MPSQETIEFINRFKQYPPEMQQRFDANKIAEKYPEINMGRFAERFNLKIDTSVQPDIVEESMFPTEEPSLGESIGQAARAIGKGLTLGALDIADLPFGLGDPLGLKETPQDPLIASAGQLAGEAVPITRTAAFAKKIIPGMGLLRAGVRGALAGGAYETGRETIAGEKLSPTGIATSAAIWGGFELGGTALARVARRIVERRAKKKFAALLKDAFEQEGVKKPIEEWESFTESLKRRYPKSSEIAGEPIRGEGFVIEPWQEALERAGKRQRPQQLTAGLRTSKTGRKYIWGMGMKTGRPMRPESFWPLSGEVSGRQITQPLPEFQANLGMRGGIKPRPPVTAKPTPKPAETPGRIGQEINVFNQPNLEGIHANMKKIAADIKGGKSITLYRGLRNAKSVERAVKNKSLYQSGVEDIYFTTDYDYALHYAEGKPENVVRVTLANKYARKLRFAGDEPLATYSYPTEFKKTKLPVEKIERMGKPAVAVSPRAKQQAVTDQLKTIDEQIAAIEEQKLRPANRLNPAKTKALEQDIMKLGEQKKSILEATTPHEAYTLAAESKLSLGRDISTTENVARAEAATAKPPPSNINESATQSRFTAANNRLKSERGAVNIEWLYGPAETVGKAGEEFKNLFLAPHEALPERVWRIIYDAQHALDKSAAFYESIYLNAEKAGIKKGNKADRLIWEIMNRVDNDLLLNRPLNEVIPDELLSQLTVEQREFLPLFARSQRELAEMRGLPSFKRLSAYITWLRDDAVTHKYKDALEILQSLEGKSRKFPTKSFDPFALRRKGGEEGLKKSALESMRAYTWYGLKKAYKEPVATIIDKEMATLVGGQSKYAKIWMQDWMGTTERKFPELQNLSNALVGRIYRGALYGNVSATLTNLTQTLTATVPEIGPYWTAKGVAKLTTTEGQTAFKNSGVMADIMHGRKIETLDFFSKAEYVNRGVAYLGAYEKGIARGMTPEAAKNFALDTVEKTQFFLLGRVSAPQIHRTVPALRPALQFTQYPIGMTKRLLYWGRHHPQKLLTWAAVNVGLGGPQALVPTDGMLYFMLNDDQKEFLEQWRRKYSLSGLIGINLAPRFGLGIYPTVAPAISMVKDFANMFYNTNTQNPGLWQRYLSDELKIDFQRDIVQSRLVQRDIPLFVKGGVQLKKIADNIGLPFTNYRYENGMVIRRKDNKPVGKAEIEDRIKKTFIGEPLKQAEVRELISGTAKGRGIQRTARKESITAIVTALSEPDTEKRAGIFRDNMKILVGMGLNEKQIAESVYNEVLRQSMDRAISYSQSLSKTDRAKFMSDFQKIQKAYK